MNYFEAAAELKKNIVKPIYLISGEETYLASKLEKMIIDKVLPADERDNVMMCNPDMGIDELINMLESVPFFGGKNVLVMRNGNFFRERKKSVDQDKPNKNEEKLMQVLMNMPEYSMLILLTTEKADKRRKLYKTIAKFGAVVEVAALRAWDVKDWLNSRLREVDREFDRAAFEYFLEVTSVMNTISLGTLDQEVQKLLLYTDKKIITKDDLLQTMATSAEVSIFAMLDAISAKNIKKSLQLLSEQLTAGEHPLKLITMLSRHVRQLWQAKVFQAKGYASKQIASELGMVPFIAEKLVEKSKTFSVEKLEQAAIDLAEADFKCKSSQADCAMLDKIIIELCS